MYYCYIYSFTTWILTTNAHVKERTVQTVLAVIPETWALEQARLGRATAAV